MNKFWFVLPLTLMLTACETFGTKPQEPEVKVVHEAVELPVYQPPVPEPPQLDNVHFIVITRENLNEKIQEVERTLGQGFVVFAITPRDYEKLSGNMQELKRYQQEQKAIIEYYMSVTPTSESWAEINDKKQAEQRRKFQEENKP